MGKGKRQPELEVVRVPLAELHGYEGNAKKHTEEQLEAVKNSIKEFGFRNPVIAWHDQDGRAEIVAGHARCKAARELGVSTARVAQLCASGQLDSWKVGATRMVSEDSVFIRKMDAPRTGRPAGRKAAMA